MAQLSPQQFWSGRRVCVTGGSGFLGRAVCRLLRVHGCTQVFVPRATEFDLTDAAACRELYARACPDLVIHLAAEVGGIALNRRHPGRFFYANMAMGLNLIEEGRRAGLAKLVQIGTVCSYPKHCQTPFREDDLWLGYPEESNAPYGVAKKSLAVMLQAYRDEYGFNGVYLMPANLYGPHDNFDPESSHVIPALINRFVAAAESGKSTVTCWGTGSVSREFLYVDDAAVAVVAAAERYNDPDPINLGSGHEIKIADLASLIAETVGYRGRIVWDGARPDGQPRRCLDTQRAAEQLGWTATTDLKSGLARTVEWYSSSQAGAAVPAEHEPVLS